MYNNNYNRKIASQVEKINKNFIKNSPSEKEVMGQRKYLKGGYGENWATVGYPALQKALAKRYGNGSMSGSGFMDDFWQGFQIPFKVGAQALPYVMPFLGAGHPNYQRQNKHHHMKGEGFMDDFWQGFQIPFKVGAQALPYVMPFLGAGHQPHHTQKKRGRKSKKESMEGEGFFDDVKDTFSPYIPVVKKIIGGKKGKEFSEEGITAGSKPKNKRGNPRLGKRAEIVKKIMKEHGLSMIEASKYVKEKNLY